MRKLTLSSVGPVATLALLLLLARPPHRAYAEPGLTRPMPGGIVLGFNEAYAGDHGQARYHTGIDIAGEPGAQVKATARGSVTFCGRVPGPAGSSERVLAMTIALADGRLATYLPLDEAFVTRGNEVAQGQTLGTLAAKGDGSAAATHLHFGLREHGRYVDPGPLPLPVPPAQAEPSPAPQPHSAAAPARRLTALPTIREVATPGRPVVRSVAPRGTAARAADSTFAAIDPVGVTRRSVLARTLPHATSSQACRHAQMLRANRMRPWVDPRVLELAAEARPVGGQHVSEPRLRPPSAKAHPLGLLAASGALFAAASGLGALKRRAAAEADSAPSNACCVPAPARATRRG